MFGGYGMLLKMDTALIFGAMSFAFISICIILTVRSVTHGRWQKALQVAGILMLSSLFYAELSQWVSEEALRTIRAWVLEPTPVAFGNPEWMLTRPVAQLSFWEMDNNAKFNALALKAAFGFFPIALAFLFAAFLTWIFKSIWPGFVFAALLGAALVGGNFYGIVTGHVASLSDVELDKRSDLYHYIRSNGLTEAQAREELVGIIIRRRP
jgi:hypothetical protein